MRRCPGSRFKFRRLEFVTAALMSLSSLSLLLLPILSTDMAEKERIRWVAATVEASTAERRGTTVRKLLASDKDKEGPSTTPARVAATEERVGEECSKDDIAVYQGETPPLPNGIPTYTVQILNVCVSGCAVSDIHVGCGWFSSARLVNPRVFRRVAFDDCLVNDGAALPPGGSLSFQYANTYRYPLYVSSVACG